MTSPYPCEPGPAPRPERCQTGAAGLGVCPGHHRPDVVIIDLEDSVAVQQKELARETITKLEARLRSPAHLILPRNLIYGP